MTVYVQPHLSPRLVTVPTVDGDEISVQSTHDQLKTWEERPDSQSYPLIVKTAGKDDLGGGLFAGLNLQFQDAQIEFEANTTPIQTGTVTTANAAGTTLTDSAATFVTNLVKRGDWLVNFTDQSVSSVRTVDSEIQLTCVKLEGGTDNDFDVPDDYAIFGIIQKDLNGGNFTAVDANGATISSVFTSFGNQVIRTASVSATLTSGQPAKGVALSNFKFYMVLSTNHVSPAIGLTITAQRSRDDEALNSTDNSPTERSNGIYEINLTGSDMNGDVIAFRFTASGADARVMTLVTSS